MIEPLLILLALLMTAVLVLLVILLRRPGHGESTGLQSRLETLDRGLERLDRAARDDQSRGREEASSHARQLREEVQASIKSVQDSMMRTLGELSQVQHGQLEGFSRQVDALSRTTDQRLDRVRETVEQRLERLRETLEQRLQALQEDNTRQLDQMRKTVDEQLQGTLERRLGESFKLVSERLEQVHRGLGEMQALAVGVGDLKRVLSNVKTRGTWGEIQLHNLLEQLLTSEQYARNVATVEGSLERVEFALRLPGRDLHASDVVWLPIDAKFPQEDYLRLVEAAERADPEGVDQAGKQLEARVRNSARDIRDKYLNPPKTTDFAILYLATEGLYAEALRRPGLIDLLQRDYRVVVAGPTTLAALLNSLQMGFRTLAIQKRSSEVWDLLGAVKTEFGKFGGVLEGVNKKLQQASSSIEDVSRRSRAIERKLRGVQELPAPEAAVLLGAAGLGAAELGVTGLGTLDDPDMGEA